jgi:hypothetical protein
LDAREDELGRIVGEEVMVIIERFSEEEFDPSIVFR